MITSERQLIDQFVMLRSRRQSPHSAEYLQGMADGLEHFVHTRSTFDDVSDDLLDLPYSRTSAQGDAWLAGYSRARSQSVRNALLDFISNAQMRRETS